MAGARPDGAACADLTDSVPHSGHLYSAPLRSKGPVLGFAPLLYIEVLSRDETLTELQERVNDYASMGVGHIWAVDPWLRVGYVASMRGFVQPEDGVLLVEGTSIAVTLVDVFTELDQD